MLKATGFAICSLLSLAFLASFAIAAANGDVLNAMGNMIGACTTAYWSGSLLAMVFTPSKD